MNQESTRIGARIKAARRERGWTLQELGRRSGVSISALSKIENAQVTASFDTLLKVASGLEIGFESLLGDRSPTPVGRLIVTRSGQGDMFETDRYFYEVMSGGLRRKHMIPLHMKIKAVTISEIDEWSTHEGEEFIYVLKGPIELHTEFYEPMRLETGDGAYFDSRMRHAFVRVGRGSAEMLSICYSKGLTFPDQDEGRSLGAPKTHVKESTETS